MANAPVHRALALCGGGALALAVGLSNTLELAVIAGIACIVGELWLSPDLDLGEGSRAYRWWGPLRVIWWPYMALVPHRSALSHWPVLGSAGRLLYLGAPVLVALWAADVDVAVLVTAHRAEVAAVVAGLEVSVWVHWIADRCA